MQVKRCTKCGEVKSVDEFGKDSKTKDGKFYWCKPCGRAATAAWRAAYPERAAAAKAKYRASGRAREAERRRYAENPESGRAKSRKYAKANPDRVRESMAQWKKANPKAPSLASAKWKRENPERARAQALSPTCQRAWRVPRDRAC